MKKITLFVLCIVALSSAASAQPRPKIVPQNGSSAQAELLAAQSTYDNWVQQTIAARLKVQQRKDVAAICDAAVVKANADAVVVNAAVVKANADVVKANADAVVVNANAAYAKTQVAYYERSLIDINNSALIALNALNKIKASITP